MSSHVRSNSFIESIHLNDEYPSTLSIFVTHHLPCSHHQPSYLSRRVSELLTLLINHLKQLLLTPSAANETQTKLTPYLHQIYSTSNLKHSLQSFFHHFVTILNNAIIRITKFHCDKKLKYLIQTVCKQIFVQLLRLAYELKKQTMEVVRVYQSHSLIILDRLTRLILLGRIRAPFNALKAQYKHGLKADIRFVARFEDRINSLERLVGKFRNKHYSNYLYKWRIGCHDAINLETTTAISFGRKVVEQMEPTMDEPRVVASINHLLAQIQHHLSSNSSITYIHHPSSIPSIHQNLTKCLQTAEIQYTNADSKGGSMLIPVGNKGAYHLEWREDLEMNVFRTVMKLVETTNALIQSAFDLSNRLRSSEKHMQENKWQSLLFNQYLPANPIKDATPKHLTSQLQKQLQELNEQEMEDEMSSMEAYLTQLNIQSLSIYHQHQETVILPCLSMRDALPFSQDVIKTILDKFNTDLDCHYLTLPKNNRDIHIVRIDKGFCKYTFAQNHSNNIKWEYLREILIPIILNNYQQCTFSPNNYIPSTSTLLTQLKKSSQLLDGQAITSILCSHSFKQLECNIYSALKSRISENLFCKMIYPLHGQYYWTLNSQSQISQLGDVHINTQHHYLSPNNPYYTYFHALLKDSPLFQHSALQIYQHQNKSPMHIIYATSPKVTIFLGYFSNTEVNSSYVSILKVICECISANPSAIQLTDMAQWVTSIQKEKYLNILSQKMEQQFASFKRSYHPSEAWHQAIIAYIPKVLLCACMDVQIYRYLPSHNAFLNLTHNTKYKSPQPLGSLVTEPFCSHSNLPSKTYKYLVGTNSLKNKLKQVLISIPRLDQEATNHRIKRLLERKYQPNGIHESFNKLEKILLLPQDIGYLFVPNQQHNILVVIAVNVADVLNITHQLQAIIAHHINHSINYVLAKNQQNLHLEPYYTIKNNLLSHKTNQHILNIIQKFHQRVTFKQSVSKNIANTLSNIFSTRHTFSLQKGFYAIMHSISTKRSLYRASAQNLSAIIESMLYRSAISQIILHLHRNTHLQSIYHIMHGLYNLSAPFELIRNQALRRQSLATHHKNQSCLVLEAIIAHAVKSRMRVFWDSYHRRQRGIKKVMDLMAQEYQLSVFNSLKDFLEFAQDRLACGINEVTHQTCSLTLGIIQGQILYFKQSTQVLTLNPLPSSYSSIPIGHLGTHALVYKLQHSGKAQLKQQQQWLLGLISNAIIPSYIGYFNSLIAKTKCLLKAFPNHEHSCFVEMKCLYRRSKAKDYKQSNQQYKQNQIRYAQIEAQYQSITQKHKSKPQLKQPKAKLIETQELQNKTIINFHIKRKTNATHRMLYYLSHKQSPSNFNFNQYQQYNYNVKHQQYATNHRMGVFLNTILTKAIHNRKRKEIKQGFDKIFIHSKWVQDASHKPINKIR